MSGWHGGRQAAIAANLANVDTAAGAALLNGVAYRAPRPGSAVTKAFELVPGVNDLAATGVALTGGTPQMSVTFAPAFW